MKKTKPVDPSLPRLRAMLALKKLSGKLQATVLSDGRIAARYDIGISRPIQLSDSVVVDRDLLFSAFRDAVDGSAPRPLKTKDGSVLESRISIEDDDAGIVEIGARRVRFPHAALLSGQPTRRSAIVEHAIARLSLAHCHVAELMALVDREEFSSDDFLQVVTLLSSAPEAFAESFQERVKSPIGETDLLPDDERHWENLTATPERSATLRQYIDDELAIARRSRMAVDPAHGLRAMSLTFCSPELVPLDLFSRLEADTVMWALEGIVDVDDHFALAGAFEICVDWVKRDTRFIEIGERILDRLLADMERLRRGCGMFAAAFVVSTARLAMHEATRHQPPYWRRLAAASHAALVVRTCGVSDIDDHELRAWGMRTRGQEYFFSVLVDMVAEPEWRPDWIDSGFVQADAFGRVYDAFMSLKPEIVPKKWQERIMQAKVWIEKNDLEPLRTFPAVLQGARRLQIPEVASLPTPAKDALNRLSRDPSSENLLILTPLVHSFGVLPNVSDVYKVVHAIKNNIQSFDDRTIQAAIRFAAHIGVLAKDAALSELIAQTCLDKARTIKENQSIFELVFRLTECASAKMDRTGARKDLARQLEALAFILPSGALAANLVDLLESLERVDGEMGPLLGRALHAAKLGVSHPTVA